MASSQHPTTMEKLPGDVLSNIFIRLLAKQVAQMRCICKPWNALLSESSFVKSHLQRSIQNNDDVLLLFNSKFSFHYKPFTARPSRSPYLEHTNFIKLPVDVQYTSTRGDVVGSVNGLICLSFGPIHDSTYYIWNPSLSAVITLPPSLVPSQNYNVLGIPPRFGYDPKTDDYKIVKVAGDAIPPNMIFQSSQRVILYADTKTKTVDYKVEVYSMRKGSWKFITQRCPARISMFMLKIEVCVDGHDGHVHWFGDTVGSKLQTIAAFNLDAETFYEIPLPDSIIHHNGSRFNVLGVLAGKLCVMSSVLDGQHYGECEVWVMDEYGVVESWVKHHVFSEFTNIIPLGFTLRNEFLFKVNEVGDDDDDFEVFDDHHFGLYDPVAAEAKFFKLHPGISKIFEYVDSLVWVAPAKCEMDCSISQLQIL